DAAGGMHRRRKVPAQSVPAAVLAAPIKPSIVVADVCAHAMPLIVTTATRKPIPIAGDFISCPRGGIFDITFREKSRNLFAATGVLPGTSRSLKMKRIIGSLAFATVLSCLAFGQTADKPLTFELADVHPSLPSTLASLSGGVPRAGRYELRNANMI